MSASVDIVIPLYNKAAYIEQAIRSVQAQTIPIHAILIADDASSDHGRDIVRQLAEQDSRIHLIESPYEMPSGPSATRNRGIDRCTSEFVAFLDGDDWWEAEKLSLQLPLFSAPQVGLVHCGSRAVDVQGNMIGEQIPPPRLSDQSALYDAVRLGTYPVTGSASGVVMRRSLLQDIKGFPEHLRFGEDWDLWARAAGQAMFDSVALPLVNIRVLQTYARTLSSEKEYFLWLLVFERWKEDKRFMKQASAEARLRMIPTQLEIFWQRNFLDLLIGFPQRVKTDGGALGAQSCGSTVQYWSGLYRLLPHIARSIAEKLRRAIK